MAKCNTSISCLVSLVLLGNIALLMKNLLQNRIKYWDTEKTQSFSMKEYNSDARSITVKESELLRTEKSRPGVGMSLTTLVSPNVEERRRIPQQKLKKAGNIVKKKKVSPWRWIHAVEHCEAKDRKQRLPNVLLIGERKAGTFKIVQFLVASNQRITTSFAGETHFFDIDSEFKRGLEWYRKKMAPSCPSDIIIVKTPSYFRTPYVPRRVYDFNKDIRLVVSLRDPVSRAISDFHFVQRSLGRFEKKSFVELALTKNGEVNSSFPPVIRSLYHRSFKQWLSYFPMEQFHVVDADAFAHENPSGELMKIEQFLGLDPLCTQEKFYKTEAGFYQLVGRKYVQGEKGHSHPPVPEPVIQQLQSFYKPSVERLFKLLGWKLSWMDKYLT